MAPPIKIVLLILAALAHRIAVTPPQPPSKQEERISHKTLFERAPRPLSSLLQSLTVGFFMTECAILLASYLQSPEASRILSNVCSVSSPSLTELSAMSPLFLLGVGMMYSSALLRLWCYKTLGTLFTWEISIKRDHKLVTSGPYAIVRHPSYTGSVIMMVGTALTGLSPGSYINECRILSTPGRWIVFVWSSLLGWVIVALLRRGEVEDAILRKEFGETWDRYSRTVPHRFVPGVI